MPVESDDDRAAFLNADEFGATGDYRTRGGTVVEDIAGLFDKPSLTVDMGEGAPSQDVKSTFFCRESDLPSDAQGGDAGDSLTIDGVRYAVAELKPDGTGMVSIVLGA